MGVGSGVLVGVAVGAGVAVAVGGGVGERVGEGVGLGRGVGVGVAVAVGKGVGVRVGVGVEEPHATRASVKRTNEVIAVTDSPIKGVLLDPRWIRAGHPLAVLRCPYSWTP